MTNNTNTRGASFNHYLMHALRVEITDQGHNISSAAKAAQCGQQQLSGWLNGVHEMTSERFHQVVTDIGGDPAKVFARAVESMQRGDALPKRPKRAPKKSPGRMAHDALTAGVPLVNTFPLGA